MVILWPDGATVLPSYIWLVGQHIWHSLVFKLTLVSTLHVLTGQSRSWLHALVPAPVMPLLYPVLRPTAQIFTQYHAEGLLLVAQHGIHVHVQRSLHSELLAAAALLDYQL